MKLSVQTTSVIPGLHEGAKKQQNVIIIQRQTKSRYVNDLKIFKNYVQMVKQFKIQILIIIILINRSLRFLVLQLRFCGLTTFALETFWIKTKLAKKLKKNRLIPNWISRGRQATLFSYYSFFSIFPLNTL